jgi:thiamine biosynthesis lipoprotein
MRLCDRGRVAVAAFALTTACVGAPADPAHEVVKFGGPTMGTTWSLTVVPDRAMDAAERESIDRQVQDTLARITALMSTWDENSELSRFNRARTTEAFPIAPDTYEVFRWALALSEETGHAFDMTVLPVVEAWGFGAGGDRDALPPSSATLTRLKAATGPGRVELDPAGGSVRKRHPAVACDVSGLAPGYAADLIASALERRGLTDFLLDVGGEFVARGRNAAGSPWQVAVERPDALTREVEHVVPLTNMALATSGDYRNYREVNGRRVTHIIDPRTAEPIDHRLASVTVLDPRAVRADGLATALMVLGPGEGLALAAQLKLPALFVVRRPGGFEKLTTPQFDAVTKVPYTPQ